MLLMSDHMRAFYSTSCRLTTRIQGETDDLKPFALDQVPNPVLELFLLLVSVHSRF